MRQWWIAGVALCAASAAWADDAPSPKDNPGLGSILFWTPAQQEAGYKAIEKTYPVRTVAHGGNTFALPKADSEPAIAYDFQGAKWDTDKFMQEARTSGLLIIKDGKIVLERYGLGRKPEDRWVSFSVTKSVTSTLVGAAIKDGFIKSLDAMVTDYIPELKGSAYDGVTIRQILTMTSGVKWNEDYSDPKSDAALFALGKPGPDGVDPIIAYMAKLPREAAPGTKYNYKTGESDMVGILVENATHKRLADYLSEKIWSKFGMESDANWMLDLAGHEIGGCCISATLRDFGRFGMFALGGGVAGGEQIVPPDYLAAATSNLVTSNFGGEGYGYQWWIPSPGTYEAIGIFGQSIYVNPAEKLVIVVNSAWARADDPAPYVVHDAYVEAVIKALHGK